ncbi:hypothetical protein [Natronosalvus rutilus]|uniref:Uncharacterized protein n=1 Tax=Natronosalvus rutilus TaxID=2953753 RepID=A0A9E7NDT0_9EURY|nr:hypothetical protein [Natronosalvus rutilus]UTF56010.1 hypothetical protein NGM29_20700 [Natronosalvus rutilus]
MRDELRARREETWRLLVEMGIGYSDAVARIAENFDCNESTVKTDISRMETWIGELDVAYYSGVSRLRELRQQRQRLNQMALEARQQEDLTTEKSVRQEIRQNLESDMRMSQRLGLTNEEPQQFELAQGLEPEDEELLDEFCGVEGEAVSLEEMA